MSKVRQIIKLYSQGIGKKRIADRLSVSKNTVKEHIEFFNKLKVTWDELSKLTDFELNKVFNPPQIPPPTDKLKQLQAFFPTLEKQLRRRGMTLARQYREYQALHPDGFKNTQFYHYYQIWCKKIKVSMPIQHFAGDKLYIDYAGAKLPYVDEHTGEIKEAEVFVAILGWSQYSYVEATANQTLEEFITATENALLFIQGVTLGVVPDNLKSAVFKASNYEPQLNENFRAFADHYGFAILPTRSRKPQDKAHVENMVKITYQRIYAELPEKEIMTLNDLNIAIRGLLDIHNNTVLTGKDCSRTDQFKLELPSLQPLPATLYEIRKIKQVTVMKIGHVQLTEDQHYYSVPYELIGKKLSMHYSRSKVEMYLQYELVASHKRIKSPHNYSTIPDHMPSEHRYVAEWSPAFFMDKAKAIDPVVEYYISQVLAKKQHPEQAYKSCQGILSFAKRAGKERLIKACKRAHEIGYYNYKTIDDILTRNIDMLEDEQEPASMPDHENVRGSNYYQ